MTTKKINKENFEDIIKCGLGLTKTEFKIMEYFIQDTSKECITISISKSMNLNLTTVQKAVKKLADKDYHKTSKKFK